MMLFSGCITALVTPFNNDMSVNFAGLEANVDFQIRNGVSGIVPLGTTGESPTISDEERNEIIRVCVEASAGRVPVMVGTGTNSTEKTIKYTKEAQSLGADAALVVSPYYNKPSQDGLFRHFSSVADCSGLPLIIYNIQGRTGVNIETPTLARLAENRNIMGVKEASGSISQAMDVLHQLPREFVVLSGDDNMTLPLISLGGRGVISVVSNLAPRKVSDMVGLAIAGDFVRARALHFELLSLFKSAFVETNPMPIKALMGFANMPSGPCRPPLYGVSAQNLERLRAISGQFVSASLG